MSSRIKKHVPIFREDSSFMDQLIEEKDFIEDWGQALHYLIQQYKQKENIERLIKEIGEIKSKQKHMSLEQSTLSELVSDYLFIEHYHDDYVHVNNGTETEAWANARKLALKHIKENQEDMSHKQHKHEAYEHRKKRIISSQQETNSSLEIRPNIKRTGGLI